MKSRMLVQVVDIGEHTLLGAFMGPFLRGAWFFECAMHCCLRPSHSWVHERGVHPQTTVVSFTRLRLW